MPWRRPVAFLLLAALSWWLTGCALLPSPQQRLQAAQGMAQAAGWHQIEIAAPPFVLSAWLPPQRVQDTAEPLTVYIEGDGLAWRTSSSISPDPTPVNPLGLKLALAQPTGKVAYLARPCQFRDMLNSPSCENKFWTSHRFAPEIIEAENHAVSELLSLTRSERVRLVGYSGGGAVAALIAARRSDVVQLITVAGNLDPGAWTSERGLDPLNGSLNPIDFTGELSVIPQLLLVGGKDETIGENLARSYQAAFPADKHPTIRVFPSFDHHCCWVEGWPEIYREITAAPKAALAKE